MKTYYNDQLHAECALLSSINASIFFDEPFLRRDSEKFKRLYKLVSCHTGAAIGVERVDPYLNIKRHSIKKRKRNFKFINSKLQKGFPVDIAIYHKAHHIHSVLLTESKKKDGVWFVRALNFKAITQNTGGWVKWEQVEKYWKPNTLLSFSWFSKMK